MTFSHCIREASGCTWSCSSISPTSAMSLGLCQLFLIASAADMRLERSSRFCWNKRIFCKPKEIQHKTQEQGREDNSFWRQAILLKARLLHLNISQLHAKQRHFYWWTAWRMTSLLNSKWWLCQLCSGQSDDKYSLYVSTDFLRHLLNLGQDTLKFRGFLLPSAHLSGLWWDITFQ